MIFTDKIVVITDASSRIGAATACKFAELGAELVLVGRNVKNLQEIEKKCTYDGRRKPLIITAEMTNDSDVYNIVKTTIGHFHRIDVLVNNKDVLEIETDIQEYGFNVNSRSIIRLTMAAIVDIIQSKGNIVNVSSVTGLRCFPCYYATNNAINQFTKSTALQFAPQQVRINSVDSGVMITDFPERGGMSASQYAEFLEKCETTYALGTAGEVEEVANTIAFLASDLASSITGVNLPGDGGRYAMYD